MTQTTYTVDLRGSDKFTKGVAELRKVAKRRDADGRPLAQFHDDKTWTVQLADGDSATDNALGYLRLIGATVTEQAATPDLVALQAERERLLARLAEIDQILGEQ